MYTIENNIPVPAKLGPGHTKTPLRMIVEQLEVGQSFLIGEDRKTALRVSAMSVVVGKKFGRKFTVRKTPDGYRAWRTA